MCPKIRESFMIMLALGASLIVAGWSGPVRSQEKYPTRAIEIICPYGPGAATDMVDRITADYLKRKWGVSINVVNKPGGNTVPACLEVYNSTPDGYTLFGENLPNTPMLPFAVKNLPFKIMDRTFIGMVALSPMVVMVPSASTIKSIKELETEARKDPGNFTWTSQGGSSATDFVLRQLFRTLDIDVLKTKAVMCKSGAEVTVLTAGGHVKLGSTSVSAVLPAVKAGTIRVLAVTSKQRWPELPDVPTTEEVGYPSVNVTARLGISGPPKLPSYIAEIWEKPLQEMVKEPDVISKLKSFGCIPFYANARETREMVVKEIEEVERLFIVK